MATFHDFDEYERLVEAAKAIDARAHLLVLFAAATPASAAAR